MDGNFEERGVDGRKRRFLRAFLAGGASDAHQSRTGIGHHGLDVRKVHIDDTRSGYEVGDAFHRLPQYIVAFPESIFKVYVFFRELKQFVIWDDYNGVDFLRELLDAFLGDFHTLTAFEEERLGDYCNREYALFPRSARHDRRCARARAAAHTAGKEYHIRAFDHVLYLGLGFFRSLFADIRIHAGAQAFGEIFTDMYLFLRERVMQVLRVRVHGYEGHTPDLLIYHMIYSVFSGSADTDDHNAGKTLDGLVYFWHNFSCDLIVNLYKYYTNRKQEKVKPRKS